MKKNIYLKIALLTIFTSFLFNVRIVESQTSCPWSAPLDLTALPGSGSIQTQSSVLRGNNGSRLVQALWQGNQGFWRDVPVDTNGDPQWANAGDWSQPLSLSTWPGSGSIQTQSDVLIGNGTKLLQALWRGDQGYSRTVPVVNGEPQWANAGDWSQPLSSSILPGSGSIQTHSDVLIGKGTKLLQALWRGDQGYSRTVPVDVNGNPQWSCVAGGSCPWSAPLDLTVLPGSGLIQTQSGVLIGKGTKLLQAIWRGDQGFSRIVPVDVNGNPQWNCGAPTATPTATPVPSTATPIPGCICNTDGTCATVCAFDKFAAPITYANPIKCSLSDSLFATVPSTANKTSWCQANKKTNGDADGNGVINNTDYFYYVAAVNGGKIPVIANPDFNGDGEVGATDRIIIIKSLNP